MSDFSVFHHQRHPLWIPAGEFFPLANRLHHYNGAVAASLRAEASAPAPVERRLPTVEELRQQRFAGTKFLGPGEQIRHVDPAKLLRQVGARA